MKGNICIVVPINSSIFNINSMHIKKVNDEKPEFIELRFDFIDKVENLTLEFINKLKSIINREISTIFTFRGYSEGGNIQVTKDDRLKILKSLISAHPDYIDIELNSDPRLLNQVIKSTIKNNVKIIFSYHDHQKTPNYNEALDFTRKLVDTLRNKISIDLDNLEGYIYKFVFTAQKFQDNLIPLKICKDFKNRKQRVISFCMGELGIFSRITCLITGSFLTYSFIDQRIVSGQIDIKLLREIYQLLSNSNFLQNI